MRRAAVPKVANGIPASAKFSCLNHRISSGREMECEVFLC